MRIDRVLLPSLLACFSACAVDADVGNTTSTEQALTYNSLWWSTCAPSNMGCPTFNVGHQQRTGRSRERGVRPGRVERRLPPRSEGQRRGRGGFQEPFAVGDVPSPFLSSLSTARDECRGRVLQRQRQHRDRAHLEERRFEQRDEHDADGARPSMFPERGLQHVPDRLQKLQRHRSGSHRRRPMGARRYDCPGCHR